MIFPQGSFLDSLIVLQAKCVDLPGFLFPKTVDILGLEFAFAHSTAYFTWAISEVGFDYFSAIEY